MYCEQSIHFLFISLYVVHLINIVSCAFPLSFLFLFPSLLIFLTCLPIIFILIIIVFPLLYSFLFFLERERFRLFSLLIFFSQAWLQVDLWDNPVFCSWSTNTTPLLFLIFRFFSNSSPCGSYNHAGH